MLPTCVNPREPAEVVYFQEKQMTESQIETRLKPIRDAVALLRKDVKSIKSAVPSTAVTDQSKLNWLQKNPWAGAIMGALITTVVGTIGFGFVIPRVIDHAMGDLDSNIDKRTEQKLNDHHIADTQSSVERMEGELKTVTDNVNLLLGKSIKQAASLSRPDLKQQLPQINGILNAAMAHKIPVDGGVVNDLRTKLGSLAKQSDQQAWQATLTLASYRTVFNENPFASFSVKPILSGKGKASFDPGEPPPNDRPPIFAASINPASKETGAQYETLGQDLNPGTTAVNAFVTLTDGGVVLDNKHIRNAVFTGVHVVYNGGPLILENVVFINCIFTIVNNGNGEQLIAKSFESPKVTLTAT